LLCGAFPVETTEAFLPPQQAKTPCRGPRLEGHARALAYFGGVPKRFLYDNSKIAVAQILGGEERKKTRAFLDRYSGERKVNLKLYFLNPL
jgi:transposase